MINRIIYVAIFVFLYQGVLFAEKYSIKNVLSISIPESMELQDGAYKKLVDSFKEYYFDVTPVKNRVVFQQKGLSDQKANAQQTYARIILTYDYNKDLIGVGPKLSYFDISKDEIEYMGKSIKKNVDNEMKKINNNLVSYNPTVLVQTPNYSYFKTSYTRAASNKKSVYVERYTIYNNGYILNISVSARVDEKDTTFKEIWNCVNSISLY